MMTLLFTRFAVAGVLAIAASATAPAPAGAATVVVTRGSLAAIIAHDPALTQRLDNPGTVMLDRRGVLLPGLSHVSPGRAYKNVNQFRRDLRDGVIPSAIRVVIYDPESWALTPLLQQQHPYRYMRKFVHLAKVAGLRSILAPARTLIRTKAGCGQLPGVQMRARYLQCGLSSAGGAAYARTRLAGTFLVPTQRDEWTPDAFGSFYDRAAEQARRVHPALHVLVGLTAGLVQGSASASVLTHAAAAAPTADGYWLSVNRNDPAAVSAMAGLLEAVTIR